jgi:hypothetical protein
LTRTSSVSRAAGSSAVSGNSSSAAAVTATGGGGSALTVEEQQSIKGKAIVKLVDGQKDLTVDAVVRLLGRAVFKSENSFVDMREKVTLSIEALYSVSLFIGSSSTRQKKLGEQEKVFQHVVKLFDTFQDTLTICENAVNALTTLCRCGKGPDKFSAVNVESCGTAGACELLVMTVKKYLAESCGPASVDFTAKGFALISYLSESSAKNRKKLVDAGACQVVADALDGLGRSDATVAQKVRLCTA